MAHVSGLSQVPAALDSLMNQFCFGVSERMETLRRRVWPDFNAGDFSVGRRTDAGRNASN